MKTFILALIVVLTKNCYSQDLTLYTDSTYNFTIGIPKDWKYQPLDISNMGLKLNVIKPRESDLDTSKVSFNVNLVPFPNSNIDTAYANMKKTISARNGYRFIGEGDTMIDGKKYKWIIEEHSSITTKEPMTAYIYLGYKDNHAYMVTFSASTPDFEKYRLLYKQIGSTFRL
jgi:hypothetical protein